VKQRRRMVLSWYGDGRAYILINRVL